MYHTFRLCVCSLSYPARNAHAPYCLSVACPALPYFPTLSHKPRDFTKKKVTEHKMCVLIFCTTFETVFRQKNWVRCGHKFALVFMWSTCSAWEMFKNVEISNFVNIRPVAAELLHADGQTDMTTYIVAARNLWKMGATETTQIVDVWSSFWEKA